MRSRSSWRAIAETDGPCRCKSSIITSSPSRITAAPLPPIGRDHRVIGNRCAVGVPRTPPGRSGVAPGENSNGGSGENHSGADTPQLAQQIGSGFATRIEGTCVKHRFGKSSIKIYDKFALVLRIETTTNDVSAFKHYRKVEHQQGPASYALAPVKKNIYSLTALAHILLGCNRRYLEYLSSLDDFSAGVRALDRLTQPRTVNGRSLRGLNFFSRAEQTLLSALQRPAFNIAGLRRADLLPLLAQSAPATLTRHLARLRQLGVIKRVTGTYRYYLTRAGRAAIAAGRRLTELTIIPALAQ